MAKRKRYWLMKSEPDVYPLEQLKEDVTTPWTGIRNYQARNLMRDDTSVGDGVLFYHSNTKKKGVVGVARVSSEPYPDPTQFDKKSKYFDEKSNNDDPTWVLVDIEYVATFDEVVELSDLKANDKLKEMAVVQKFQRLSVQPVTAAEWKEVLRMAGIKKSPL